MRLATFSNKGTIRIGVIDNENIVDLLSATPRLPNEMMMFLASGESALTTAEQALDSTEHRIPLSEITLEAPIQRPNKFLGVGLNYMDHVQETGRDAPKNLMVFNKQSTCVNGPYAPFYMPRISEQLDYECELGVVIGKQCRHVSKEDAHMVIAGYTIVNDVSVRDVQHRSPTTTLGKSYDTHGPMGPWIVTVDEIDDPHNLICKTWVNDELRQETNTQHLIFNCYDIISQVSSITTLEPGDVIATGTSSGVGMGFDPPKWLQVGDIVRMEIEKIGMISNEVIAEPLTTARIG